MPKRKLLQIGYITSRMANKLEAEFDIIEYFKFANKEKLITEHEQEIVCVLTDGHWGVPDNLMERLLQNEPKLLRQKFIITHEQKKIMIIAITLHQKNLRKMLMFYSL